MWKHLTNPQPLRVHGCAARGNTVQPGSHNTPLNPHTLQILNGDARVHVGFIGDGSLRSPFSGSTVITQGGRLTYYGGYV